MNNNYAITKSCQAILLVTLLVFTACKDKQQESWEITQSIDTIEEYQNFLALYPESKYAPDAKNRLDELLHPLKDIGFPYLQITDAPVKSSCLEDTSGLNKYIVIKETSITSSELEKYFGANLNNITYPEGGVIITNDGGGRGIIGDVCFGNFLMSGSARMKSGVLILEESTVIALPKN